MLKVSLERNMVPNTLHLLQLFVRNGVSLGGSEMAISPSRPDKPRPSDCLNKGDRHVRLHALHTKKMHAVAGDDRGTGGDGSMHAFVPKREFDLAHKS